MYLQTTVSGYVTDVFSPHLFVVVVAAVVH